MKSSWFLRETKEKLSLVNTNMVSIESLNNHILNNKGEDDCLWIMKTEEEVLSIQIERRIDSLVIQKEADEKTFNLSFIKQLSVVTLGIHNSKFLALTSELVLPNVSYVVVDDAAGVLDLSGFSSELELYVIKWNKKFSVYGADRISNLTVKSYNPVVDKSFMSLSIFYNVSKLILEVTSIENLDGIDRLLHLKELKLAYAKKLVNISAIKRLSELSEVSFQNCKKIESYEALSAVPSLKKISVWKSSPIESLSVFKKLDLDRLVFLETKVLDGDKTLLTH